ncbi:MAG: hypothetical protein RSP_17790 [Rhodanobacter sp.]
MDQELTTHEKVLGSLEDAAMYQDLGTDARERAAGAKSAWSKLRDRLNTVTQDHQTWREGHKLSAWLHDNGWIKNTTLAQHEDRQRRYTSREADAHVAHVNARDEVRRLDKNLVHSQDQASAGWRQLEQEREQQEKAAQQRQETAAASRAQQHEQASPSQTTARRQDPADRFTGELLESGFAPYLDVEKNSRSYFVKLRLDDGKETKHWGVDLERAVEEAGAGAGDRIEVKRTGADRSVEVEEEGQKIHAVRKGWEVTNLSHQHELEPEIEAPVQVEHAEPVAEFQQEAREKFDQARDRIAELRDLNMIQPWEQNEDLMQHGDVELPGGATVSLTEFKTPIEPAIEQALDHQAHNADYDRASDDTTPLHTAVQQNKLDLVQRLLDHGADPNFEISEFAANLDSPLVPLMRAQTPEMVDLLCQHGADVQQCLWHEDMLSKPELTQAFLDRGLDPNARTTAQVQQVDALDLFNASHPTQEPLEREAGESALHMTQDPEVARRLVLAGADVNFNAGTQKEPLGVTQAWRDDIETGERGRVSKGTEFEQAIHSATQQRQQSMQTQAFGSVELPRTKQEQQQEQSRLNLGQRVMQNNVELPQPGRRPSLGEAARNALQPQQQQQSQDDQGQGSGGRRGGQDRPSHSSFYQPIPVGGMAPPTPDERSAAIQQQDKARRRSLSRSF